jgi:lysozyme family protein
MREINEDRLKKVGIFGEVTEQTIIDLTQAQAEKIYYSEFWVNAPFDKIMNGISGKYIFDMCVNHGMAESIRLTQRACCAAQKVKDFLVDDGGFGSKTLSAINQMSFMLIPALIATRVGYVRQLVAVNPKLDVFLDDWLTRCFDVSY